MEYSKKRIIRKAIPDNDPNGLVDIVKVSRDLSIKGIKVHVNIEHPYSGDISIELSNPRGIKKTIHSPSRVPGKNLKKTFEGDVLSSLVEGKSRGEWFLKVVDAGARDDGHLVDWTLDLTLANSKKSEIIVDDHEVLNSSQVCHQGGKIVSLSANVNIEHSHIGDLSVDLVSPSGKKVNLNNKSGGATKNLEKAFSKEDLKDFLGEKAKGKWTLSIADSLKGDAGKLVKWGLNIKTSNASPKSDKKDDLTKIEGIGPKIAGLLNDAKIHSFEKLASSSAEEIKKILEAAGPRFKMHDPGSWPKQSQLAATGQWKELEILQDELQGGK